MSAESVPVPPMVLQQVGMLYLNLCAAQERIAQLDAAVAQLSQPQPDTPASP